VEQSGKAENDWDFFIVLFASHTFIFIQHGFSYICRSYVILNKLRIVIYL